MGLEADAQAAELRVEKAPDKQEALKAAILAAELYMKLIQISYSEDEKARLRSKCNQLLSRAEEIKRAKNYPPAASKDVLLKAPVSGRELSKREDIILLEGSKLHGFIFPPWTSEPNDSAFDDVPHKKSLYTDPTDLKLSHAQRQIFAGWERPHESLGQPLLSDDSHIQGTEVVMDSAEEIDLIQDITTDCSVVASLCAGTARALKGHGQLLTSIVYPFDESNGKPQISKNGKYIFRLHFNGCYRKVTIDDRLPASTSSRRLHVIDRNNPRLLWPALLEKAYLKVRGGYDFPGSNSGTDLWVLTGWIPEQVFLQSDDLEPDMLWHRILKSFGYGDVMITVGTGRLPQKEEKELGLAGEHDYAILDMKESGTQRQLLVKNPWCDGMTWKGQVLVPKSDEPEERTWTQDIREALPTRTTISPGTFWMTLEDIVQHFESLYLNWNPGLFRYRQDHHFSWTLPAMTNPGSFIHNPQYAFKSSKAGTVWILLSRHFATSEHDIALSASTPSSGTSSALGFISLYVFNSASGQRVYLSDDAFHRGAYVDSPQTLARLEVPDSTTYTIVCAQQGLPLPKYSFTLSFFSRSPLTVTTAPPGLPHFTSHAGSWTAHTAGGNASSATYPVNPQFSILVSAPTPITLILETSDPELAVHVKMVYSGGERVTSVTGKDILLSSGDYRRGSALASLASTDAGRYTIVCSTFEAGQTGDFTLRVGSSTPCEVRPILAETAGRLSTRLPALVFHDGVDRMLADFNVNRLTRLRVVARAGRAAAANSASRSRPLLKISLENGQGPNKRVLDVSGNGGFSDAPSGVRTADLDVSPSMCVVGGLWIVVERLGGRNGVDEVDLEILSDGAVSVGFWRGERGWVDR